MDKDIREFVLKTLEREYGFLADELRRAEQSVNQGRIDADPAFLNMRKSQAEVARKALAYFGVYR